MSHLKHSLTVAKCLAPSLNMSHELVSQLEQSKRSSEKFVYELPEPVFVIDRNARILKANKAAESLKNAPNASLFNSSLAAFFSAKNWEKFKENLEAFTQSPSTKLCTFELTVKDAGEQTLCYQWNIRQITGLSPRRGPLFFVVADNISQIKGLLEKLQEKHKDLEQHSRNLETLLRRVQKQRGQIVESSKLAQLGEMAGGIAHEINNPITIIKGHAEHIKHALETRAYDSNMLERSTRVISSSVERVFAIVKSMCSLAKDGSNDTFESSNIVQIVLESTEFFREKMRFKKIKLSIVEARQSIMVDCRGVQISQVLINLIGNAIDAIENLDDPWIEIAVVDSADKVTLRVTDSGPRISDDLAEKIMQPFFTTKQVGAGTGLGLSITRSIVQQHGGEFTLDRHSETTSFILELPKVHKRPAKSQ